MGAVINGWAPVWHENRDEDPDQWVNLRQATGMRIHQHKNKYRLAAMFGTRMVVLDLPPCSAWMTAAEDLRNLLRTLG